MLRLLFVIGLFLAWASPGMAQSTSRIQALIVAVCGTAPNSGYTVGTMQFVTMDPNGQLCPGTSGGGGGSVTQGTTPWVDDITQWGNVNVLAGAGATGTGSPRTTQAQDTTTIAGSAPGTPSAPSANVITTQGAARSSVSSTSVEANHIITASAGSLYSFEVQADSTLSAAAWWIMIYNATTAPADGAVTPIKCYQMGSGVLGANFAFPSPIAFSTGIVIGVSTTGCFTKTASAHAFISGDF